MDLPIFYAWNECYSSFRAEFGSLKLSRRWIMIHFFLHQLLILEHGWNSSKKRALQSSQLLNGWIPTSCRWRFHRSMGTCGWWGQDCERCPGRARPLGLTPFYLPAADCSRHRSTYPQRASSCRNPSSSATESSLKLKREPWKTRPSCHSPEGKKSQKQVKGMGRLCSSLWIAFQNAFFPK